MFNFLTIKTTIQLMMTHNLANIFTDKKLIFIIILFSVLVRLLYLPVPFVINVADGAGYVAMADEALAGNWASFFDNYIYRTPMYPFFIAFSKIIFGKSFVYGLPWIQHALGVLMAVLMFMIGKKVFNKWVGFIAGMLTGISAYQVYFEHNSMSDFFFSFITVLAMYLFLNALLTRKKNDYILFGIVFGLNLLTRPLLQLFLVVFPLMIFLFDRNLKRVFKKFIWIMIPVVIIITPWFLQNWYRHHYFGFTPFTGVQLIVRAQNYIDFTSDLGKEEKKIYLQTMLEEGKCNQEMIKKGICGQVAVAGWANLQRKLGYSPTKANQALQEIALEAIKKNPTRYLKETFYQMKMLLINNPKETFFADIDLDPAFRQKYYQKLAEKDSWTIFHQKTNWNITVKMINFALLALPGIIIALFKKNTKAFLFILLALYIFLVTSAIEEGTVTRYRIPLDPYIFLFASYTLIGVIDIVRAINKKYEECLVQ